MILSVSICIASFLVLVALLRHRRISFGLPVAYLFTLLFIHVPGAIAHIVGDGILPETDVTEIGIRLTAFSSVAFVIGVWLTGMRKEKVRDRPAPARRRDFALCCLIAGLGITYSLRLVISAPSIGAVIEKGGGIWVLGCLLGLRLALRRASPKEVILWLGAMAIYPALTLLLGGFLSFGSTPVFIILSSLVISTRSSWRVAVGLPLVTFLFFSLFLNYFQNRDQIRDSVWGGASMKDRVEKSMLMIQDIEVFSPNNAEQLRALDLRLNQNFFVGRAAVRLESGEVTWLHGRSFWEGFIALVPRAIWPSKPVVAGSPEIIMRMTGFMVNDTTSYGVGNVMEFYINFGMPSLVGGFLLLGTLFGWLDRRAALAERGGDLGMAIVFFMPAAAMIHPNGSLVELTSGGAAALVAAYGWRWAWQQWSVRHPGKTGREGRAATGRRRRKARPGIDGGSNEAEGLLPAPASTRIEDHGG